MAFDGGNMTTPKPMPRDVEIAEVLARAGKEAQEQIHFHRSQLAMWERVGAAAQAGLGQLHADEPAEADWDDQETHIQAQQDFRRKGGF